MSRHIISLTAVAALLPGLAGCGDSGTSTVRITASDTSALRQALGSVALDEFESICLNVVDVRVRIASDDAGSGWHSLALAPQDEAAEPTRDPACPLDLADLLRGEQIELAWGEVPSGDMTELRFVLAEDQGYAIKAGDESQTHIPVFVPSGSQSGLKLKGAPIYLEPDEEEEVHLIFDAEASIREHNDGAIRIRPVIRISGSATNPDDGTGGTGGGPILQ